MEVKKCNIMEVTRVFHPVGQGAFYTESFEDKRMVVYDCGGKSREFMEEYIDSFLPENPKQQIDAIFISHLHNDHINGLDHLLSRANVKKIFLPLFTPNEIVESLLFNTAFFQKKESVDSNQTILALLTRSSDRTQIIEVDEFREDNTFPDNQLLNLDEELNKRNEISHGTQLELAINSDLNSHASHLSWIYIPYNTEFPAPTLDFTGIKEVEIIEPIVRDILSIYEKIKEVNDKRYYIQGTEELITFLQSTAIYKVKDVYKALYGGVHNSQSMTVFSGLRIKDGDYFDIISQSNLLRNACNKSYWHCHHGMCDCMCHIYCEEKVPCNFLYMGDFEAKVEKHFKALKLFYTRQDVWDTLCGIQIPHHGSRDNYNKGLYDDKCFAIASAGIKNQYNHPHIDTLINIVNQGCCPNVVTEDINTLKYQHFNIK